MAALAFFSPGPMELIILLILFAMVAIPVVIGGIIWLIVSKSSKSNAPKDASNLPPCPTCGAGVSPNAVSCPRCGEPLGTGGDEGA